MEAPVPVVEAKKKPPVTRVQYHGTAGQVLRLHIMNLLMNVITLGIYSFWGKTRIRRYITSNITIGKDRFEYTGTGKELLLGWLKALLIFIPLIIAINIPFVNFVALPIFFAVVSVAIYLALRYRLSRTRWRGIRFSLTGSVKEYLILSIKRTFINIFTLGWKIPKSDILKWSYIANNMSYGHLKFSYQGDESRLKKVHLVTMLICIVMIVFPLLIGGFLKGIELIQQAQTKQVASQYQQIPNSRMAGNSSTSSMDYSAPIPDSRSQKPNYSSKRDLIIIPLIYLGFGIGILSRMWYHAALWQEKFRGLRIGQLRFKMDVTGKGLAKLYFTNMLLIIFTLGLAKPIAMQRVVRYYTTNLRIGGDMALLVAEQDKQALRSGMGDALAADVGFDLGL